MIPDERYPGSGIPAKKLTVQPLHVQLRDALIKRVASGEWRPGEVIPNEIDLAREFNLSPGTVRKALDWMEQARIVIRQQGRGTFVADPASAELATRFECIHRPDGSKAVFTATDTTCASGTPTPRECDILQLADGAPVLRVGQVRRSELDVVAMVEEVALPAQLFSQLSLGPGESYDIVRAAKHCQVLLGGGTENVFVVQAPDAVAARFGLAGDVQIMMLERLIYTVDGKPAELRKAWCWLGDNSYRARLS